MPEQQGQGLAKALIVEIERYARTQGKKYVNVKFE
ncbi:GNAT family N-acetyltransferase [Lysinibacillus parviboronicapiens]|nr:GNAT family N-acetyltransferase [Lysinibacillus parviboronicapiens]